MQVFSKVLRVGKENRFSFDLSSFADQQLIDGATISTASANLSIGSTNIDGNIVSALFTGVEAGRAIIDVEYSTVTRGSCSKVQIAIAGC